MSIPKHSRLSPSKATQWTNCTASIPFIEENAARLPREQSSAYADEGTEAHSWSEQVLKGDITLEAVPDEFRPHVKVYVESILALIEPGSRLLVEQRVPLFYLPEERGTVDATVITPLPKIHIRDLKYGAGVLVKSAFNKQLSIYAWSLICQLIDSGIDLELDTPVTIHAVQPRHREWVDEPWETTVGELQEYCTNEILKPATLILTHGATRFAPSEDACRWCAAKAICTEREKFLMGLPSQDFDNLDEILPESVSDERLLELFKYTKEIKSYLDDVAKYLHERAVLMNPVVGTKLVQGRQGNRKWVDDLTADTQLALLGLEIDERYTRSLRSPSEVEGILKEKGLHVPIDTLVTRSPGKPTLALVTDKRPEIKPASDDYSNLEEEDDG